MSSKIHLEIVTPDKSFYEADVKMVVIETTEGEIGILNDHEPLVTPVAIGHIWIDLGDEKKSAACSKGFLTVQDNEATVVVNSAEWKDEIDLQRAKEAKKRAKELLDERSDETDVVRAKASLKRAINRIRVHKM
ncbi:MAG: F0F1 ATP synthase subunit epsilon [Bacillota bacterium]